MKKTLFFALLAIALAAMPAFASVQNVKVSGNIDNTWVVRDQFDLGHQSQGNQFYQNFLLTQTRLRVDADLTDNVSTTVALINERAWDQDAEGSSGANDIDINLAYVTLREMLYSPLTVMVGRQKLAYGNQFIIGSGPNNVINAGGLNNVAEDLTKRIAFDAVRMVLDYNPLTIDLVAAKIDANNLAGTGAHDDDVDLFGANANWNLGDRFNTVLEGYFWAKLDKSVKSGSGVKTADTVYAPGIHAATNPIEGLNLSAEGVMQLGNKVVSNRLVDRDAIGGQVMANYMLPFEATKDWSPVVTGAYTYASGDSDPDATNEDYEAWDPMFENLAGGKIFNTLFDFTNCHIATARGAVKPLEDVTASLEWNGVWLAKPLADTDNNGQTTLAIRQPDGTAITAATTTNDKVGDEVTLGLNYDYTEDVQLGASYSMFFPGRVFAAENWQNASQVLVNANVSF